MAIGFDRADDLAQLQIQDELVRDGMPPAEAEVEAARMVLREKQRRSRERMPRTPDGRPALSPREAALDADMALAMGQPLSAGNGAEVDNLAGADTPIAMDAGLGRRPVPQSERVYQDDPTGGMGAQVAAREAEAARNWAERGEVYGRQAEEYRRKYGDQRVGLTPEQQAARDADTRARDAQAEATRDQRIHAMAARAGVTPAQARAMMDEARPEADGPLTHAQRLVETQQLRDMAAARRQADLAERRQAVVRTRMAQTNPLEYMNRPDISDWNRMVAADAMLRRGYRGATPLDVEQAAETALALQEQRRAIAAGDPAAPQALVDAKIAAERQKMRADNPAAAGAADLAGNNFATPEAQAVLDDLAEQADTGTGGLWWAPGYGAMSEKDEAALAAMIRGRFNVSPAMAQYLAREAANRRRRGPFGGDWGMLPTVPMPGQD